MLEPFETFVVTIAADNGKERAGHRRIGAALEAKVYFARPYYFFVIEEVIGRMA